MLNVTRRRGIVVGIVYLRQVKGEAEILFTTLYFRARLQWYREDRSSVIESRT